MENAMISESPSIETHGGSAPPSMDAGKPASVAMTNAEADAQRSVERNRSQSAIDIYGSSPLYEALEILKCLHCGKSIKESHFRVHVAACLALLPIESRLRSLKTVGLTSTEAEEFLVSEKIQSPRTPLLTQENSREKTTLPDSRVKCSTMGSPAAGVSGSLSQSRSTAAYSAVSSFHILPMEDLSLLCHERFRATSKKRLMKSWTQTILFGPVGPELLAPSPSNRSTIVSADADKKKGKGAKAKAGAKYRVKKAKKPALTAAMKANKSKTSKETIIKTTKKLPSNLQKGSSLGSLPVSRKGSMSKSASTSLIRSTSKDVAKMNPAVASRIGMIRAQLSEATQRAQAETKARAAAAAAARGIKLDLSSSSAELSHSLSTFSKAKAKSKVKAMKPSKLVKPVGKAKAKAKPKAKARLPSTSVAKAKAKATISKAKDRAMTSKLSEMAAKGLTKRSPVIFGKTGSSPLFSRMGVNQEGPHPPPAKTMRADGARLHGKPSSSMISLLELKRLQKSRTAGTKPHSIGEGIAQNLAAAKIARSPSSGPSAPSMNISGLGTAKATGLKTGSVPYSTTG